MVSNDGLDKLFINYCTFYKSAVFPSNANPLSNQNPAILLNIKSLLDEQSQRMDGLEEELVDSRQLKRPEEILKEVL